ncbi:MAG: TonB-dependent receptor [Candidatus Amulumruptor caecigallinarius]|nr:TonB-dependent receptor [Candidatus Amulumruptor caecigallinarius]MCM1397803.1 TonB-dependent receptor [Candidatus Amulumruptor caecigallinarius]MCM1454854.1 TonB-dependent receptor [bacterium]
MMMGLLCTLAVNAQNITVSGTVTDASGEPLIGASVMVKGTSNGTATDIDGNYKLTAPANGTLAFSYVGYNNQEVAINGQTTINVTLDENTVVLGEVVAIGYGVVKKSDATGSVAMVKPDDVDAGMATSAQDLLVGASPGVVVTTNGGDPTGNATIRIRGGSSLSASNNPLIVIDGVPMSNQDAAGGTNALTMVNPQNIESMTILKDASATAIYGSRASNGVIIITTKKGTAGKPQINFAANWHVNTARKTLDLMNGAQFRDVVENTLKSETAIAQLGDADTDWQDEVLRTSFSQDYSLSVGGTAGFLPYRVNASYTNNQGIIKTSSMQRTTVGFNLTPKFFNGKLSVSANAQGSYVRTRNADTGAIGGATAFNPTLPVKTAYNTLDMNSRTAMAPIYNGYTNILAKTGLPDAQAAQNPLQLLEDVDSKGTSLSSNGNLQIDYALHFLPELHLNLNLGYQVSQNKTKTETAQNSIQSWRNTALTNIGQRGAGTLYDWYELQRNTLLDFYVNYRKDFAAIKSNLDVMAGYSWQKFDYHGRSHTEMSTMGYSTPFSLDKDGNPVPYVLDGSDYLITPNTANADAYPGLVVVPKTSWSEPLQLVSFFGRLNYTFDDTYLLTFTIRDDGTSRFSKDNRWGVFPSVALGWKIANMPFFEPIRDKWNDLKLRLGWGVTGQQDLGGSYFPYMAIYNLSNYNGNLGFFYPGYGQSSTNPEWIEPLYPSSYDPDIKWEETTTWNIGLDAAWLNNRITLAADWYLRNTKDLLAWVPVAGLNTGNYMNRNIGSLRNTGVEVTVTAKPVVTKNFTWSTSYNVAYNMNKITALTGDAQTDQLQARNTPSGTGTGLQYHMVGEPAYTYRVYQQVYDQAGDPVPGVYVDQNGDGVINDADLINFHNPTAPWTMTWNNNFNYKNWDLGISLRANIGNYVYNGPKYDRSRLANVEGYGLNNLLNDTYLFPVATASDQLILSSYFVENASFLRCDNITLGYTFNPMLKDRLNLRVFAAVQNPFVITKYKGLDPEVESGIDNNVYPRPITATLGLVATF